MSGRGCDMKFAALGHMVRLISAMAVRQVIASFMYSQNSTRACKAIMRGLLSPPSPTPSKPVGGEVVYVSAPNPLCVEGFPGMPA